MAMCEQKLKSGKEENLLTEGVPILAKYSYKAKTDSPLGIELNLKQKEEDMKFVKLHENKAWSLIIKKDGSKGFVPTSYIMSIAKLSGMPWLHWKVEENIPINPMKPSMKKSVIKEYKCDLCVKEFNGPIPLSAHLRSKAHKLEVELNEEYEK